MRSHILEAFKKKYKNGYPCVGGSESINKTIRSMRRDPIIVAPVVLDILILAGLRSITEEYAAKKFEMLVQSPDASYVSDDFIWQIPQILMDVLGPHFCWQQGVNPVKL